MQANKLEEVRPEPLTINELVERSHAMATEKGFWKDGLNVGDKMSLIHCEVSEAYEEYRKTDHEITEVYYPPEKNGPQGFGVEMADIVIRCADLCGYLGIDLEAMIRLKMAYNATREHMHGGKRT